MNTTSDSGDPSQDPQIGALLAEAGWVLALAKRLARDQAAAEDIAQGALALALERRPAVNDGLRPWLAKVVGRLARRSIRSESRRQNREALAAPTRGAKSEGTDEVLERFELQQELARRLDALNEPYRGVLIRRYYEGLSVKEIARATGSSPATVRSQLARALERLRLQYDHESEGRGALGVFLLAAGSSTGFVSRRSAELFLMQTSTKVVAATAAALLVVVAVIGPDYGSSAGAGETHLEAQAALTEVTPPANDFGGNTSSLVDVSDADDARVALEADDVAPATSDTLAVPVEGPAGNVTTLRARLVGEQLVPLAGATLSSIYPDGRPRGTGSVARSDSTGRVVLELTDDAVRKWRDQPLDMLFAAEAAEHATTFVVKQLRLHGVTDLGEIRLELGGSLVGTTVDSEGLPIAGAVLYAGAGVTNQDPDTWRLTGPGSDVPRARAISAADGTFELSGVQALLADGRAATARVWAHTPGRLWTRTEPFKITPRGRVDVGRLVIEEVPTELRIEGTVLRPDGLPATGARVDYFSKGAPYGGSAVADEHGHFLVVAKDDSLMDLVARGSDEEGGNLGMSSPVTAKRGESVELRLRERRVLTVVVTDTDGAPIHDAHLRPVLEDGLVPGVDWTYTDELGRAKIEAPAASFSVWARKTGFGEGKIGPFEYDTAADQLSLTLQRGAHVKGRVLAYGEPVEGAQVTAMRIHEHFVVMTGNFPNRYASGVPGVTTDAEGRFLAPLKEDWATVGLVARSEGLATGEVIVEIWSDDGERDVEIHLTEGGAIEGVVTPPPGMEDAGLYVAASRGDGTPLSTRVDAGGRYRFEGLTPGNWRVEGRLREVGTETLSISRHPDDMEPNWNAVVVDRETLEFDVDMRHLVDVEVQGQLSIDGSAPPKAWSVEVVRPRHQHDIEEVSAILLDDAGRFTFTTRPGRADLRLVGSMPDGARIEMLREVRLQGPKFEWEESLSTAPVEEWLDGFPEQARFVRGLEDQGARELTFVSVGKDGLLRARVPVGSSSLQVPAREDPSGKAWEVVREIVVP